MIVPELDKNFRPIILEIRKFNDDVAKAKNKQRLYVAGRR